MRKSINKNRILDLVYGAGAILSVFLLWFFATVFTNLGFLIPNPLKVISSFFRSFWVPIGPYRLFGHVIWSIGRVFVGFGIASLVGITIGITMGWSKTIEAIFKPIVETIRSIPPIAWTPIAILWFGLGEMPKYFIIFIAAFNNIVVNAYTGAKNVDETLIGAAKMLGANQFKIFTTIVIPASLPFIFAGLQVGLSVSFAVLLAAEMIRSTEGLGWIIISGMAINDTAQIFVGILTIGIVGFLLATIMRAINKKLLVWNRSGI
jgi:ABC-type nitrate/sulfonate/bicarbonate transport system permease component